MGILEQITEMKRQGVSDEEIITALREHGFSPRQIKDALDQSQIKEAVYGAEETPTEVAQVPSPTSEAPAPSYKEPGGLYMPQTKEIPPEGTYPEGEYYEEYPREFYQPEAPEYAGTTGGLDTETIIEISEQVFSEKMKKLQKRLTEFSEFKTLSQARVENISERIKRIEEMIDTLQAAILEKIGSYGKTLESIRKEMSMMQDSFGKMIPGFVEKSSREIEPRTEESEEEFPLKEKIKTKKISKKKI